VLEAVLANWKAGRAYMAEEFCSNNDAATQQRFAAALDGVQRIFEPHVTFKLRVPHAIGLIRTGETVQYANTILESA
jgi:D-ribose pyranase